jgi:putative nucleotidyltransferase with HDIG domain
MTPTRADAEAVLFEFTQSDALRRHARGVEAMRAYARWFGVTDPAEVEKWGIVGLLHDFDYEQNPTAETHLHVGCRILRERGFPEEIVEAIASHADYMGVPRDTPMKKALYGCDELVGFIGAAVKVRPTKKVADLPGLGDAEAQGQGFRAFGGPRLRLRRCRGFRPVFRGVYRFRYCCAGVDR